jgi:hypothetical protein
MMAFKACGYKGFMHVRGTKISAAIGVWPRYVEDAATLMQTRFRDFDLGNASKASSATSGHGSFASRDGEKPSAIRATQCTESGWISVREPLLHRAICLL